MPKKNKTLCVDDLRHAEYYGMQPVFDELYHRSLEGENFTDLMDLILSRDNILLAYRNIKANGGSYTAGTDNKNISDIGCLPPETVAEKVRFIVTGSQHGYRPKPVRRKDIPKPNGKTRPLGIPCIWDRLVQQCIKQVIEPICEAKFSDNSYGFRPNRSVEHAVQKTYTMLQRMNLHYVIEFDIKGFFDNVNHSKLMRQIWAMGIHDKQLIFIIKRILKAPIRMPDGTTLIPDKGTPQGGIISPLLANIVLNELDKWVESQWQNHPLVKEYGYERKIRNSITFDRSKAFLKMRKTGLKEMYIVRYADDFRIFCRNKEDALRTKEAVTAWITERLRLEVSPEKTRIVNVRKRYSEFLGFKIRVRPKSRKYIVQSHICDKKLELERQKLVEQAKRIALLWSSFFVTLVAKKIVLINLCCRPCFIWGSITIITVWTNMIIINVCKFFYLLIECFLCCKLIQICAFILQGIEVTLHRCIVVRISCFAHALCHIYRFAEFGKCFGRIL